MDSIKDWLVTRCRNVKGELENQLQSLDKERKTHLNIVTPNTIPTFYIPSSHNNDEDSNSLSSGPSPRHSPVCPSPSHLLPTPTTFQRSKSLPGEDFRSSHITKHRSHSWNEDDKQSEATTSCRLTRRASSKRRKVPSVVAPLGVPLQSGSEQYSSERSPSERSNRTYSRRRSSLPRVEDADLEKLKICKPNSEFGELKYALQYCKKTERLKLTLLKAENLRSTDPEETLNPFVKVMLMPTKVQKQTSIIHKRTNNPVFNETFFFETLPPNKLSETRLVMKIFHKSANLKREEKLGEVTVEFNSKQDLVKEIREWREIDKAELGMLQLSVKFEPKNESLSVGVLRANDLRKQLGRAPDTYVRVELKQANKKMAKFETETIKKSTHPAHKQFFSLPISPKIDDLNETTLYVTVYAQMRLRSDDPRGQVRLGRNATEESEFEQWNRILQYPGVEVIQWHHLMEID